MPTIEGFRLLANEEEDNDQDAAAPTAGESPGTDAVMSAADELMTTYRAHEILMAAPGFTPKSKEVYPHTQACEARLLAAAEFIRKAVEELKLAKAATE